MPINIKRIHDDFEARIDELLDLEKGVDAMASQRPVLEEWTRRRLMESILVFAFSHYERFIESLFYCYLATDLSRMAETWDLRLPATAPLPMAEALIAGQTYFDFKSYGDLLGRANRLLVNHPFGRVQTAQRTLVDAMQAMRNHVLHRSRKSLGQLRHHVPARREIGVHLKALVAGATRLTGYLNMLKGFSKQMR